MELWTVRVSPNEIGSVIGSGTGLGMKRVMRIGKIDSTEPEDGEIRWMFSK